MSSTSSAIIFLNVGTPDSYKVADVRSYLREFLSDPRVIDIPWVFKNLLLYGVILPFRSPRSAKLYKKVWTAKGSPLLTYTQDFVKSLQEMRSPGSPSINFAMRYGSPSIKQQLEKLLNKKQITIFPLFPQYASSSTGTAVAECFNILKKSWNIPAVKVVAPFYNHPGYIKAYVTLIKEKQQQTKDWEHLIFSYHGLPERHIIKSEGEENLCKRTQPCPKNNVSNYCYRAQCYESSRLMASQLSLSEDQYTVCFQSRLGRTPWIHPYTDDVLKKLREKGIKRIGVVCPSFVIDCLETLQEIGMEALEDWVSLGGENLSLVPCLNASKQWLDAVWDIAET